MNESNRILMYRLTLRGKIFKDRKADSWLDLTLQKSFIEARTLDGLAARLAAKLPSLPGTNTSLSFSLEGRSIILMGNLFDCVVEYRALVYKDGVGYQLESEKVEKFFQRFLDYLD